MDVDVDVDVDGTVAVLSVVPVAILKLIKTK